MKPYGRADGQLVQIEDVSLQFGTIMQWNSPSNS
jgi:hypothetical protein